MRPFHHLLTAVVLAVVLRWLWNSSDIERAKFEDGRHLFPPTRVMRIVITSCGLGFAALFVGFQLSAHQPSDWWVPYLFLGFLALILFAYPPVLSIETDGVGSRSWFGGEKKIRWEEIASLHYNTGNRQFVVRAKDGRKISHAGFNADAGQFQCQILERTRLPLKMTRPGTWKSETYEIPYEDVAPEEWE